MSIHNYCTLEQHQKMLAAGFRVRNNPAMEYYRTVETGAQVVALTSERLRSRGDSFWWVAMIINSSGELTLSVSHTDNFQDPITALVTAEVRGWRAQ